MPWFTLGFSATLPSDGPDAPGANGVDPAAGGQSADVDRVPLATPQPVIRRPSGHGAPAGEKLTYVTRELLDHYGYTDACNACSELFMGGKNRWNTSFDRVPRTD